MHHLLPIIGFCTGLAIAVPAAPAPAVAGIQLKRGFYNTPPPDYAPPSTRADGPGCKPPKPTSTDNCSTRTVCADYINECGMMYGGCFSDCRPWPTFTPPPCPSGWSTSTEPEPTPTITTSIEDPCQRTICVDYVNECGKAYGGCHPDCAPYPTYTPPPCP